MKTLLVIVIAVGWGLLFGLALYAASAPAGAATITFAKAHTCANGQPPKVVSRGDDVLLKCGDKVILTITNAKLTCPAVRATRDAATNMTVYCPSADQ